MQSEGKIISDVKGEITQERLARKDSRNRVVIGQTKHQAYKVVHFETGMIVLTPHNEPTKLQERKLHGQA